MSGIAAIVETAGTADPAVIERLTTALSSFGPDGQRTWAEGPIALGHAMLETVPEAASEHQPLTIDGQCWIVADARLDAREDLIAMLRGPSRTALQSLPDAALILHAYIAFGDRCVEYLLGDFAFAIWDAPRKILFCARDHFGLKPLFYARNHSRLIFSSSIGALRREVDASAIDELAIADFLLFAYKQDDSATSFQAIRKLPPAHIARITPDGKMTVRRYWTLPVEEPVRYKRPSEYVDHFRHLLHLSVRDRLRTPSMRPVAVLLSGGLDSCALAVNALGESGPPLAAYTFAFDRLVAHEEPQYARQVASHLGIPQEMLRSDQHPAFHRFGEPGFLPCEPLNEPFLAETQAGYRRVSETSRVVLTGNCGDEILSPSALYPGYAFRHGRGTELLRDLTGFWRRHRKLPRIGLRTSLRKAMGMRLPPPPAPAFPSWLKSDFVMRLDLKSRWREVFSRPRLHPTRPAAYDALTANPWRYVMEEFTPNLAGAPLEFRHPFLDLRLVRFALRLPDFPYCVKKQILRSALAGRLPQPILSRPKTPMRDDPLCASLRQTPIPTPSTAVQHFVDTKKLQSAFGSLAASSTWVDIRPLALDYFLNSLQFDKRRKTA